ncbi:MAG: acyl-CoA dehydrogenase [Pseudomonadota bacterium]
MNFDLTEDQALFDDSVRRFGERELADGCVARAMSGAYPWDVSERMAAFGLLGITIPEADGGQGGTLADAVIAIQAIAAHCPRSADVVQTGNFGAIRTFAEYASAEQKARYLPDLLAGKAIMAVGMTEPEAGSAVTELTTRLTPDGDGYRLSGTKIFGTHSGEASVFLVYARFGPGVGGIGSVLVRRGADGFTIGTPSGFMNGEHWSELHFDNVRIEPGDVLLGPGGFKRQISGFNVERLGNAARSVSVGRHAFDVARAYCQTRHQFGRPLCEFQGLQWSFAEMAVALEGAQLMLMRAVVNADRGLPTAQETAMAKLACNEAGYAAANAAMQAMGGHGFSDDSIVQYCVRRTRAWMIAGGSIEVLKNRIAEGVFERRFSQRAVPPAVAAE